MLEESFSTLGTNHERGTGFGLILCKDFVELNGGCLSVVSEEKKVVYFIIVYQNNFVKFVVRVFLCMVNGIHIRFIMY